MGQEKEQQSFFSAFYFMINLGSTLSIILTPILRGKVMKKAVLVIIRIYHHDHEFVDRIDNSVQRVSAWHHKNPLSDAK